MEVTLEEENSSCLYRFVDSFNPYSNGSYFGRSQERYDNFKQK